jgi:hypothetical protein
VVQDINEWPIIDPLPSYGRGRDKIGGRFASLIGGSNLTDVVITGEWSEMFSVKTKDDVHIFNLFSFIIRNKCSEPN